MSVQDVVDGVVAVLSRAESLFTPPADPATSQMTAAINDASEASRAIGARTDELGGALASAHHDMLDRSLGASRRLAIPILSSSRAHAGRRGARQRGSQATELRQGAEDVPSRLGPGVSCPPPNWPHCWP